MTLERWKCPYCAQTHTVTDEYHTPQAIEMPAGSPLRGEEAFVFDLICCPNPDCTKPTAIASLWKGNPKARSHFSSPITTERTKMLNEWRFLPSSRARPFPAFVPDFIRNDYEEACAVESVSPKASATLSRRCLQAILRNFYPDQTAKKPNLRDEIAAVIDHVGADMAAALHALRDIGNVGAHPERDPSIISEVEPGEAAEMIGLIELLIEETYIARYEKAEKLARVQQLSKKAKKAVSTNPP